MAIPIQCAKCSAKMSAPDAAAGKRVKCPKCAAVIAVPVAEDDFEIVEDEPRPPVKAAVAKKPAPVVIVDEDEEEDERPAKKSRRRDEDDEDERPRKKKVAAKKKGVPIWIFAVGGVGMLAVIGIAIGAVVMLSGGKPGAPGALGGPGGALGPSTPAGYTAVRETDGGFAVFLPGDAKKTNAKFNGQNVSELGHFGWKVDAVRDDDPDGKQAGAHSRPLPVGAKPGTDQAALMQLLTEIDSFVTDSEKIAVVSKRAVTLGGKPGLEVKVKEKAQQRGKPGETGVWTEIDREERERVAKAGLHTVTYFTHDGKRIYSIRISQKRAFPSDDVLKIIVESFSFL